MRDGCLQEVSELVNLPVAPRSIQLSESQSVGLSNDLSLPAQCSVQSACGAHSPVRASSRGSKSSENTSTASVSFYTSADAASKSVAMGGDSSL